MTRNMTKALMQSFLESSEQDILDFQQIISSLSDHNVKFRNDILSMGRCYENK